MSEPRGIPTLRETDAWWRQRWAQHQNAAELAARYQLHIDDVYARLQRAGVELRGRPAEGQRKLFELPQPKRRWWRVTIEQGKTSTVVQVEAFSARRAVHRAKEDVFGKANVAGVRTFATPMIEEQSA